MRESLVFAAALVLFAQDALAQEARPGARPAPGTAAATVEPAGPMTSPNQQMATPAPTLGHPAPRITFEDAVQRALNHNPNTVTAYEEIRRAEALVQQVRSTWLPTLYGNASYTRLDSDRVQAGKVIASADTINANLTLTVPIVSPRQWVATTRAKENRELTRVTFVDTRRQMAILAGRAYLTIIAQRRLLESAVQARDTARVHEEFSKARLQGGVGNRLDYVRAAQERATAETRVQAQTIALSRSEEALGILLGENGPIDAMDTTLGTPPTLQAALSEADKRSDVVVSRDHVEYARRAVRDTYTNYLPMLSGVAEPFYQNPASLTTPATGWQAQLLLSLPIYDGGYRYGIKHELDSLYSEAKTKLDATLKQARSDVRIAFEAVLRADDGLAQAREAAKLAEEALQLAQLAYQAGATTNIEVVDAERQARDAEIDAAVAEDSSRQARLDLLAASGRFP